MQNIFQRYEEKYKRPVGRYNIYREWEGKYTRRVNKIRENPNPALLKSNLLEYEILRDEAVEEAETFESGSKEPVLYCNANTPDRFFKAMGFRTNNIEFNADRLTRDQVERYFALGRAHGFTDNTCDRVFLTHTTGICGDYPPPDIVFATVCDCELITSQAMLSAARYWGVPLIGIDMPFIEEAEMGPAEYLDAIKFMRRQMEEIIKTCEDMFPGRIKYDADKLEEYQVMDREFSKAGQDVMRLIANARPCPISGRDALRMAPNHIVGDPRVAEYMRQFRDEVKERIRQGISPLKDNIERFRLYWMCSAPFFEDPFSFLEARGVSNPLYEESAFGANLRYTVRNYEEAERRFGRRLRDPLEEEAAVNATNHWAGSGNRRISEVLYHCREFGIDGIVHFMLQGCLPLNNIERITGERAEKELGVKNFYMRDVHCQDMERFNEAEFEANLWDWLEMCLAEKESRRKH